MPNVELDPPNLPECPSADAMLIVKPKVIVVHQRAVEIDIIVGMGNPVRRPCRLKAGGTEPGHIPVIHENLNGMGFIQILGRAAP